MTSVKFLDPKNMSSSARKRLERIIKNKNKTKKRKGQTRSRMYITKADISGPVIEENANSSTSDNSTVKNNSNNKQNTNTRSSGNNSETKKAKMRNTNLNLHYQNWEAIQKKYNLPDPEPPKTPKPNIETEPKFPPGLGVEPIYVNVDVLKRYRGKSKKVSRKPRLSNIKESSNEPPPIPRNRPRSKSSSIVTRKRPLPVPKVSSIRPSKPKKPTREAPKPPTSISTQGSTTKIPRRKVSSKSRIPAFKYKAKGRKKKSLKKKKTLLKKV